MVSRIVSLGRRCGRCARDRPARLVADISGGPKALIGKTEAWAALAECRHLERVFRAARAGAGYRADPDQFGRLLDRAGLQTSNFGLGSPRFALGGLKKSA